MAEAFDVMGLLNSKSKAEAVRDNERISIEYIYPSEENEFDLQSINELAESIATIGLEQNLVVKETDDPKVYQLITGHRRLEAMKYILTNDTSIDAKIRKEIERPLCKVISKEEDPLVTEFRLFETNLQARSNKEYELLGIIDKYLSLIQRAKEKGILINGKEIKGKTKELLSKQFGISERTAVKYTSVIKCEDDDLKQDIKDGKISINAAYEQIQEKKKKETKPAKLSPYKSKEDIFMEDLIDKISQRTLTTVKIKKHQLTFFFEDEEDLNRVLEVLGLDNVVNE